MQNISCKTKIFGKSELEIDKDKDVFCDFFIASIFAAPLVTSRLFYLLCSGQGVRL